MSRLVYLAGKLVPTEDAKISVYDHGLLYGDGIFEGIRSYGGKIFRLKEHVDRLYASAQALLLPIPLTPAQMSQAIEDTLKANKITDGYIRVVVTRGAGALGLDINKTSNPQIIIIADTIQLYPEKFYEEGLEIITAATIRNHPQAVNPRVKSLNYLNNILAKIEGALAGCVEALMLNHKGEVAECTGDNVFMVRRRELFTPSLESGVLDGITRNAVLEIARKAGYCTHEIPLTRHDLYTADECFLTGTAAELIPVVKIDGRTIGSGKPGSVFQDLRERFRALTRS